MYIKYISCYIHYDIKMILKFMLLKYPDPEFIVHYLTS